VDPTDGVARLSDIGDDDFETQLTNLTVSTGLTDPYSALMNTSGAADLAGTVEPDKFSWRKDSKRRIMVMVTDSWRETDLIPGSETKADVASALATHGVEVHTINHPIADPFYDTITSATGGSTSNLGGLFATNVEASFHAIADSILDEFGTPTLSVQASDGAGPESRIDLRLPFNATAFGLRLADSNVATRENAMEAIEKIDRAINNTNKMRAKVGGYTNRLTSALNLETTSLENAELSRSRIEDADLAFETAQMAKAQILSTAATNLLTVASRIEREMVSKLLG